MTSLGPRSAPSRGPRCLTVSLRLKRNPVTLLAVFSLAIALFSSNQSPAQTGTTQAGTTQTATAQTGDLQTDIQRMDAAVRARTAAISAYTVKEQYSVFRNGEITPSVQVNVLTTYDRATGKDYKVVSQTGSDLLRKVIIDKVIANEKEMAKAENHESVSVTSANYDIQFDPASSSGATQQQNGHDCIVMRLKAKRKVTYLFNGRAWFDAHDFTLIHIEGSPAQSVSFFAGETNGTRDYDKLNGFSMASHAKVHSHSFLFGNTELTIDYTDYQIQLDPKAALQQQ